MNMEMVTGSASPHPPRSQTLGAVDMSRAANAQQQQQQQQDSPLHRVNSVPIRRSQESMLPPVPAASSVEVCFESISLSFLALLL